MSINFQKYYVYDNDEKLLGWFTESLDGIILNTSKEWENNLIYKPASWFREYCNRHELRITP